MDTRTMIERAHVAIMRDAYWCWFTSVVLLGKWRLAPVGKATVELNGKKHEINFSPITTAATDGLDVVYNEAFIQRAYEQFGDKGVRTIVLHENVHKAMRHLSTWSGLVKKNARKANVAMDIVVNNMIAATDFCVTADKLGGIYKPDMAHLQSVGEVWDALPDDESGDGSSGDQHCEPGEGESTGNKELTEGEIEALVSNAIQQGLILQRGRDPAAAQRNAQAMAPKVDWRTALRNWLCARTFGFDRNDWRRPSRRSQTLGVYMPRHYSEKTGKLLLCVDTSGSIGAELLGQFFGEIGSLCQTLQPQSVEVVWWDAAVAGVDKFKPGEYAGMQHKLKAKGGGGTEILAALGYARKQQDVKGIVVLTDGYVGDDWGQGRWPAPVFCVINSSAPCPLPHVRV